MTALDQIVEKLVAWVGTRQAWRGVDLTACKEAALRRHTDGVSMVVSLANGTRRERDELVAALARQAQRSQARVWSALLLIGAAPWLGRVTQRFVPYGDSPEDTMSVVLEAFLTVVCRRRPERRITSTWLKVQTERQVIAWLRQGGKLEGGVPDERRTARRPAPWRVRVRARRLAQVTRELDAREEVG